MKLIKKYILNLSEINELFKFGIIEYIKFKMKRWFNCKSSMNLTEKLIYKCENVLFEEIDIMKILKNMQIKSFLLNQEQLDLFEFLAKPMIYIGDQGNLTQRPGILMSSRISTKNADQIMKSYKEIKNKAEKTSIDMKILELLDLKLKNIEN